MRFAILVGLAALLIPSIALAEDCLLCGKDSTDTCAGAQQCRGTREHCRSIGCKITGTGSCSTAANVTICSSAWREDLEPVMEDCLLCGKDSTDTCAGAQQCRGTREHCRSIGCKITGTGSCSTAANVTICSSVWRGDLEPTMSFPAGAETAR